MVEEFEQEEEQGPKGLPGWMATFADMMALLMCFFVLLLAYSDMDVQKFKRIAGAMKEAFGVQNEIQIEEPPKGTDAVLRDFSPGTPESTPIKQIEQATVDSSKQFLLRDDFEKLMIQALEDKQKELESKTRTLMSQLREKLKEELNEGVLELENKGQQIIFRIREHGSFSSASAFLQPQFKPVVLKITRLVNDIPGQILVTGHTDNQPVVADLFQNNWDLSSRRAVAVAAQMLRISTFDSSRMTVTGHASNKPLQQGDSAAARQANRRVEIVVIQGSPKELEALELLRQ
jgi:chemotaxis protein MotB